MVDASEAIGGKENFRLVRNFVTKVFHSFTVGDNMRYGLVVFGVTVKARYNFLHFCCSFLSTAANKGGLSPSTGEYSGPLKLIIGQANFHSHSPPPHLRKKSTLPLLLIFVLQELHLSLWYSDFE